MFDTLASVKRLQEAGFEPRQAEVLAEEFILLASSHSATKEDIVRLEGKIDQNIARLEGKIDKDATRLEGKIDTLREELGKELSRGLKTQLYWIIGTFIAFSGLFVGSVQYLIAQPPR